MIQVASFRFNDYLENTYLLFDESLHAVIIDPGMYTVQERECIHNYIDYFGLKLDYVVITHSHIDHILGCAYMLDHYNIPLVINEKEYRNLKLMKSFAAARGFDIDEMNTKPVMVAGGEILKFGNSELEILFTPGHSQGSISLIHKQQSMIFSGDVIFNNSMGRTDLPGGNKETLLATIAETILPLPDHFTIYAGHGPVTTVGHERKNNWAIRNHFDVSAASMSAK